MKIRYIDGATQKHVYEEHTDHLPFVGDLIMFPGECCYKVLTINAQNGGVDVECRHLVTVVDEHTRNSLYYQILIDRCTCHRGSPSHNHPELGHIDIYHTFNNSYCYRRLNDNFVESILKADIDPYLVELDLKDNIKTYIFE